ncbi:transcriptional coactivator/pterin dehydratase [Aspergillus coremiiformis]|uniref:4a-hydroxytetrahydrobiopterin dehydratase n=1 Tax=Aspergillus coremiiformis TaxID=138285 RepID=A0A5N6YZQ6_9EURO|nr:transcriptional coactivator/pterin dehydratase [Aspergillus coremiiformis]
MNTVYRTIHRPSGKPTSQLGRSIRQHHHCRPIPRIYLTSASRSLRTPTKSPPTLSQTPRIFSHSSRTMATTPQFARGTDATQLQPELGTLLQQGWALDEEGRGVKKTYYFRSYFKAVSFVNVVASQSATQKHHATITLRIGSVDIHWTTHQPRGLTDKDLTMAQHCDEAAELMGSVEQDQGKKCGSFSPSPGL